MEQLPILPLGQLVVYPHVVLPLALTDPNAVQLIDEVVRGNKRLLLGVVKPIGGTEPVEGAVMQARAEELYEVGTLGSGGRMLKLGDGSVRVMVQGLRRARLAEISPGAHLCVGSQIQEKVKSRLDQNQREYVLREQLRVIRQELGEDEGEDELDELGRRLEQAGVSPEAKKVVDRELKRLRQMSPQSAEYHVARTYLEAFASLPWSRTSEDRRDLKAAREILDRDHYDLKTVKERILEYLAVRTLNPQAKGSILCFVGPPGVGKTSLGQSIAEALERRFTRVSLGGVRDEAEVRGHRRTYVGALPGRIIHALQRCETRNPLLMLDEVDKMGSDVRGDPTAALLEVLDPAQNSAFVDHYLEVPFDLSGVMFIATANALGPIPDPLLDRMEVLALPGYTPGEKLAIAKRYLLPRQLKETGLQADRASIAGRLGDVMKESAQAAWSLLRARDGGLGIPLDAFTQTDVHLHVPAGAVPKDGPSAGIAIAAALASLLCRRPARHDVAMTGELTLRGRVLPIGGLKEKLIAAAPAGVHTVLVPARHKSDLRDGPAAGKKLL